MEIIEQFKRNINQYFNEVTASIRSNKIAEESDITTGVVKDRRSKLKNRIKKLMEQAWKKQNSSHTLKIPMICSIQGNITMVQLCPLEFKTSNYKP